LARIIPLPRKCPAGHAAAFAEYRPSSVVVPIETGPRLIQEIGCHSAAPQIPRNNGRLGLPGCVVEGQNQMVSVVALLCAATMAQSDCSVDNAIDVIRLPDSGNEVGCLQDAIATLASLAIQ